VRKCRIQTDQIGGGASYRLLSGHSALAQRLEQTEVELHRAPAALMFSSGYDANVGRFCARRNMTWWSSIACFAPVHDGMLELSSEHLGSFVHNSRVPLS
jgi:8-amino-7-oxononanoate synthase